MPGKHVRFSRTNMVHSPPTPDTPPPLSNSSFSPASSSSLPTPPSYPTILPGPLPNAALYQRPPMPKSVRAHALLQFSTSPLLNVDLRHPPSTITSHHQGIPLRDFAEPATQPPLSSLTILVPHLPWTVTVYPSHPSQGYVSVNDVLEELYHSLRTNITARDYAALPSEKARRQVSLAYEQRYKRVRGTRDYEDEKQRGVLRVDFLMGRTRFMGLSSNERGAGVWLLHST
ncbi:hypothetical protein DXG01_003972 [Tephrocybe rancida]|nr:hypothetical protein DXG01_003972 [Tephrocybe rancida]